MKALYRFTLNHTTPLVVAVAIISQLRGVPENVAQAIVPATGVWCLMCFAFALDRLWRSRGDGPDGGPKDRVAVIHLPAAVKTERRKAA